MSIKQLSVFVQNESGRLYDISKTLADNNVNIRALSIAETKEFGILRLIVNDIDAAKKALEDAGNIVKVTEVIGTKIEDKPGGLASILEVVKDIGVSMEYMYAFLTTDTPYLVLRVNDNEAVEKALYDAGIYTLNPEDIKDM